MKKLILLLLIVPLSTFAQHVKKSKLSESITFEHKDITGKVFQHDFVSEILNNSRKIFVWIPEGYDLSEDKYPLLVVHDGGSVFINKKGSFGNGNMPKNDIIPKKRGWNLDEIVYELIQSKKIKPIIMVGVSNTKNRGLEYVPTRNGINYGKALIQELIPEIKKLYRINSGDIGTLGSSAGGTISLYLGWERNDVFTKAACLSPGIIFRGQNYFELFKKAKVPANLKLAMVNGSDDFDSGLQSGFDKCIDYLNKINFPKGNLLYWVDKNGNHGSRSWSLQAKDILHWMYQ
jgi:predicted alpha/beta superfamily hydrolase